MSYHPDYFDKTETSHRPDCEKRLELIEKHISTKQVIDIGCSGAYYSFGCANIPEVVSVVGIDNDYDEIKRCLEIMNKNNVQNVIFFHKGVEQDLARPAMVWAKSTCLYMSVHHHVIQKYGFETGTFILKLLSERHDQMFFDMGQKNEGCYEYEWWQKLPETEDVKAWLTEYLHENTVYDKIEIIGTSTVHGIERYFYCMEKSI